MRNSRRKKRLIDPQVQGAFVKRLLIYWACCTLLATIPLAAIHTFARPDLRPFEHFIQVVLRHWPILLMSLAILPVVVLDAIRFSHRFAGPIFRVRSELKRHARGETIRPLQFRAKDFWRDLAVQINVLVNRVEAAEANSDAQVGNRGNRETLHDQRARGGQRRQRVTRRQKSAPAGLFRVLTPTTPENLT